MRRVGNGERRSHAPKSRWELSLQISCHYGEDNSSECRSLAALAWLRVRPATFVLAKCPGGLLTPLALWVQLGPNHIAHPVAPYRAAGTNPVDFTCHLLGLARRSSKASRTSGPPKSCSSARSIRA